MAGKYIKGMASMEEKVKHVIQKYEKRQPLSYIEQQYNFRQLRPTLSVPLDTGDEELLLLGTDGPHFESGGNSSCCNNPTPASEPFNNADGAVASDAAPLLPRKNQRQSPSHSPAVRRKMHTWVRPATADSADADLKRAQQLFKSASLLVETQRMDENRALSSQDMIATAGRSTAITPHWVPFGSSSANVLDAFTSRPKLGDGSDVQYAMETSVGKMVAAKLARGHSAGIGVRVGKNGSAARSETLNGCDGASAVTKSDTVGTATHAGFGHSYSQPTGLTSMLMTSPQPLNMEDAAKMYRIVVAQHRSPAPDLVVSETLPVIFNDGGESKPYVPYAIRIDSDAFKQQLNQLKTVELQDPEATVLSLCRPHDVSLGVTYEEVLTIRAPTSSALRRERLQLSAESPPPPPHNPPTTAATALRLGRETPGAPVSPLVAGLVATTSAPGASALREEFRRGMRRQVTMPSYTVVRDVGVRGSRQSPDGGGVSERSRRRVKQRQQRASGSSPRPPHSSLAFHKAFGPTVPTITPNGMQGPRQYVALTADLRARRAPDSLADGRVFSPDVATTEFGSASPPTRRSAACEGAAAIGRVAESSYDLALSSLASSAMAVGGGRNTATSSGSGGGGGGGSDSYRASRAISSRGGSNAVASSSESRWRQSRISSSSPPSGYENRMTAAGGASSTTDVGSPASWRRQVSIPTGAGAPSEASDDDGDGGAESEMATKDGAGNDVMPAIDCVEHETGIRGVGESDGVESPLPAQLRQRGETTWRGGPEELRAMRAYIQEDLVRTRIEAQRMAESLSARRRSTSGHLLAQEWLS